MLQRPLLICAGHAPARNYPANPYPFRAGSSYLYFGGPPLEDAALLVQPGSNGDKGSTLFRVPPAPDDPLWLGLQPDSNSIAHATGIASERFADAATLPRVLAGRPAAYVAPPYPRTLETVRNLGLEAANQDELTAVIDLRLVKDAQELAALRRAADVGAQAHRAALAATAVGRTENDVEAAIHACLLAHGCRPSFSPIVTTRGEVLHGFSAGRTLEPGSLMLIDAGAEEPGGYASDITRTFPVTGQWTALQRQLYDTTLHAMRQAIDACRPGRRFRDVHTIAARAICSGLVEAGLLRSHPDELAERGAYTLFFCHGIGHLLGLDVHDMEDFGDLAGYPRGRERPTRFGDRFLRLDRDLRPGMVVTIEPGIYFVPAIWQRDDLVSPFADVVNRPAIDQLLNQHFGGIRIEENVLVHSHEQGPEVLTDHLPSRPDEVAALVGERP